jgi:putative peptidoglycan lipid II flippase
MFASTLAAGRISALNYALKLVSIFTGVIFVSLGRAALPYLARQAALGDRNYRAFTGTLRFYLWGVGLCTLALSLALFLLARPLVQMLFQRGALHVSAGSTQARSHGCRASLAGGASADVHS